MVRFRRNGVMHASEIVSLPNAPETLRQGCFGIRNQSTTITQPTCKNAIFRVGATPDCGKSAK
jgi:hypothetical protein